MTTDQEAENATAAGRHLLIQRGIDAREKERQAKQWEGVAIAQRKEIDELRTALQAARTYVDRMTIQVGPVAHEGIAPARHVLALIDAALGEGETT